MSNHVHLLVTGHRKDSLSKAIGIAHQRYSSLLNQRFGWTGHLWANRFHSCALDGEHLWAAVKYIELNPVRASMVARAVDYPWSSARAHALGERDVLLSSSSPFPGAVADWQAWLEGSLELR
jgi:putative transposase